MQSKKKLIFISLAVCIILVGTVLVLGLGKNKTTEGEYGGTRVLNPGSDEWYLSKMYTEIYLGTEAAEEKFPQSVLEEAIESGELKQKEVKTGKTLDEYLAENKLTISDVNIINYNYSNLDVTSERPELLLDYKLNKYNQLNYYNVQNKKDNHNLDVFNITGMSGEEFKEMIEYLIKEKSARLITEDISKFDDSSDTFVVILEMREGKKDETLDYEERPLKYVTFTYFKNCLVRDLMNDIVEETNVVSINIDLPLDFVLNK